MTNYNDRQVLEISKPILSDSINLLKENIKPEIKKFSINRIEKRLALIEENRRIQEKKSIFTNKKIWSNSPRKIISNKNSNKNILEYSFIEEDYKSKISKSPRIKTFYEKTKSKQISIDKKIEKIKNNTRMQSLEKIKSKVFINTKSKKIASNRSPLYLRYQETVVEKKHRLEALRHSLRLQKEEENFKHSRSKSFNQADFENWLDGNRVWMQKTTAKVEYLKKSIHEDEGEDYELIFRPKIDKTSHELAKLKRSSTSIYEKLYSERTHKIIKLQKLDFSFRPTFTPKLNKCPSYVNPNKFYQSKSKSFIFDESEINPLKISSTQATNDNKKLVVKPKTPNQVPKIKKQEDPQRKMSYILYSLNLRNFSAWSPPVNKIK
jgi:hypothetical protein